MRILVPHYEIRLSAAEQQALEALQRAGKTPQQTVRRVHIVLLAHEQRSNQAIAEAVGTSRNLVQKWRKRFALWESGPLVPESEVAPLARLEALLDLPRSGRPPDFFPRWPGTPLSPSPAKAVRSGSLAAFRATACGTWRSWSKAAARF